MQKNEFIFSKFAILQPTTDNLTKNELFHRHSSRILPVFRNSYFKEHLQAASPALFSSNFVANFEHIFASLVLVFICRIYYLQKETC